MSATPASAQSACPTGWLSELIALNASRGCMIGNTRIDNFRLATWAIEPLVNPSLTPEEIFVTPVYYWQNGFQYVGFRFGSPEHRMELGPNPTKPVVYKPYGFINVHDIKFHVDAPTAVFSRARVAYSGLVGTTASNMNMGYMVFADGDRGNPMYGQGGFRFAGRNHLAPLAASMDRVFSKKISDFDVRANYFDKTPTQFQYGVTFRNNRNGHTNTNTGVDWVEFSFGIPTAVPLGGLAIVNPEPGTIALVAGGMGLLGLVARRRRRLAA